MFYFLIVDQIKPFFDEFRVLKVLSVQFAANSINFHIDVQRGEHDSRYASTGVDKKRIFQ